MSNDTNTAPDELEIDIEESESGGDRQSTEAKAKGEGDAEVSLDLGDDSKDEDIGGSQKTTPSKAEIVAKQQEETWFGRIMAGKADVSKAPKWLQPRIQNRLDSLDSMPDFEQVLEQKVTEKLQKQQDESQFKELCDSIPKMPKSQADILRAKYAELRPLGKVKALQVALELTGMSVRAQEAEKRGLVKGSMSLPPSGLPSKEKDNILAIAGNQEKWKQFRNNGYKL